MQCKCIKNHNSSYCNLVKYLLFFIYVRTREKIDMKELPEFYKKYLTTELSLDTTENINRILDNILLRSTCFKGKWNENKSIRNIVRGLVAYNPKIRHVFGLVHIASKILEHSSESVVFWIMVKLLDLYKLSEVYESESYAIIIHTKIIQTLFTSYQYSGLKKSIVRVLCGEWIHLYLLQFRRFLQK